MHEDGGNLQTDTCWLSGTLDTVNFQTHPVNMDECGGGGTSTQIKYKIEPTDADVSGSTSGTPPRGGPTGTSSTSR